MLLTNREGGSNMFRVTFNPGRDFRHLRRDINRLVSDILGAEPEWEGGFWRPPVDRVETNTAYIVNVELPGIKKEAIKINVHNNTLTISGDKKQGDENKNHYQSECYYGPFQRSITIPGEFDAEKITAKYQNGVLQIILPKKEEGRTKEIKIET